MKSVHLILALFVISCMGEILAADRIKLGVSNLEEITEKFKDVLSLTLARPIKIPATTIEECQKIEVQCLLQETQLKLTSSPEDLTFKLEAMPGQTFIYTLELPKALAVTSLVIRGKVLGQTFDLKFKIEAGSISTIKGLADPDIEWLKGSGKIFLEVKDGLFVASSIHFPRWRIDHIQITPMDRLARIFMSSFGRFADLEKLTLGLLNSQIQTYFQDSNLHMLFANEMNRFFAKAPTILGSFKNFGVDASLMPASFSTDQRKVSIDLISGLRPTQEAHSCARGLYPKVTSPNLKMMLARASLADREESHAINISWPLSFFENAIYLMAKYPFLDRHGKLTPPLLCQNGESEIKILGKKQNFVYNFVPVKTMSLTAEEKDDGGENSGHLILNLWAELRGQSDQFPQLTFRRYENKKKVPSILINIEARLWLALTEKGLMFELKDLKFKQIVGKARLHWRFRFFSITLPLDRIKEDLEKAVITYIENNMSRMILLSPDIDLSNGHSLMLSKVRFNSDEISNTLILK